MHSQVLSCIKAIAGALLVFLLLAPKNFSCFGQDSCFTLSNFLAINDSVATNDSKFSFPPTNTSHVLFFPDLVFNCSGYITSVDMVIPLVDHPLRRTLLFQVWTNGTSDGTFYYVKHTVVLGTRRQETDPKPPGVKVQSFALSLPVDMGDVVGVYIPEDSNNGVPPLSLAYSSSNNKTVYRVKIDAPNPPCNVAFCNSSFEVKDQDYKLYVNFSSEPNNDASNMDNNVPCLSNQLCMENPTIISTSTSLLSTKSPRTTSIASSTINMSPSNTVDCLSDDCPPADTLSSTIISIIFISVVVFVILLVSVIFIVLSLVLCRKKSPRNTKKVDSAMLQHYQARNGSVYTSVSLRKESTELIPNDFPSQVPQPYSANGTDEIDALEPYAELRTVLPDFPQRKNVLITSSVIDLQQKTNTPTSPQVAASMFDLAGPVTPCVKPNVRPMLSLSSVPESPNARSMVNLNPPRRATVSGASPFLKSPTPYMQPLSNPKSTEQIFTFRDRNLKKAHTHSCMSGISSPSSVASPLLASVSENEENSTVDVTSPYQEPFADTLRSSDQKSAFCLNASPLVHDTTVSSVPVTEHCHSHKVLKKANSVDFASPYLEPSPNMKPKSLMEKFRNRSHTIAEQRGQQSSCGPHVNTEHEPSTNEEIYSKLNREQGERTRNNSVNVPPSDIYDTAHIKKYREIPRNQISIGEKLGSGHFCKVYHGTWNFEGGHLDVAVKTLKPDLGATESRKFLQEAEIMSQFLHQNIVHLHGVVSVDKPLMICLELMGRGDLKHYLKEIKTMHTNVVKNQAEYVKQFLEFCCQIASGMNYLASKDFVHRDLAARNVFLNDEMVCKIGDFGMSRDLTQDEIYESKGHNIPLRWTAPEAVNYLTYTIASDVWSYGMLLYEIWSLGYKPFHDRPVEEVHILITSSYCLPPPPGCPRSIYQLMIQCWNRDPSSRPSFSQIIDVLFENEDILLKQSTDEVKSTLGASLEEGYTLFEDLQYYYDNV